jgi:hypothetical protein
MAITRAHIKPVGAELARDGVITDAITLHERIESMSTKPSLHDIEQAEKKPLWQRLGWLAMIWTGSVVALFIVASLMRMFMNAAGLTTH